RGGHGSYGWHGWSYRPIKNAMCKRWDTPVKAHEKQQILPRRSFFGKDTTERLHIFNVLQTRFSPTEALFSGKLSYTDIARGCRGLCTKSPVRNLTQRSIRTF